MFIGLSGYPPVQGLYFLEVLHQFEYPLAVVESVEELAVAKVVETASALVEEPAAVLVVVDVAVLVVVVEPEVAAE